MVEGPSDKIDKDDYDSVAEYITDAMAEGYTIEASDFEGRPCTWCGDLLDFAEWMQDPSVVVTWDIRVQDPDESEPEPYYARYYYCSEECKKADRRAVMENSGMHPYGEEDRIHVDRLEGNV